ncbi:MAG: protein kinase [Polyangiaceae bacterium]|nr:protein kinase [Polyangiaceae bacterium]
MGDEYAPGAVIGRKYQLERTLGRGGMGVVVAAQRLHLGDLVALKILLPEFGKRPDLVARFLREGRAAASLRSERVARVFDVDTLDDGAPYIVMELLEGESLDVTVTTRGALPATEAVELVLQACEALAEAHSLGIVHRDLKPSNLFVVTGPDGTPCVKLLDFGISKVREAGQSAQLTSTDGIVGSPSYMSPEQIANPSDVDARADVWALGVILYELLSGRRPFEGDGLTSLIMKIVTERPPDLAAVAPSTPPWLQETVARCLEKRAVARFQSVSELALALAQVGTQEAARSVARITRTAELARQRGGAGSPVTPPPSPARPEASPREEPTRAHVSEAAGTGARERRPDETTGSRPRGAIDARSSQTLMATLKGHHLTIKLTARQVTAALDAEDARAAASLLRRLREVIVTHVQLEDARLYPELRQLAEQSRDADMIAIVAEFSEGMSDIGAVLTGFFEQHGDAKDLARARAEWADVYDALSSRLSAEEGSLYPLHRDLADSQSR